MASIAKKNNNLATAVLEVFTAKGYDNITLADIADASEISAITLRLKYGSVDKILDLAASYCFETVFSTLESSVRAGKSTEECWEAFRNEVVDNCTMVLFYEAYREHAGKAFDDLSACESFAKSLFPSSKDVAFLWNHFIFDAKRSATKVIQQMKHAGLSKQEATANAAVPNLCSTSMRVHIVDFNQLCAAI